MAEAAAPAAPAAAAPAPTTPATGVEERGTLDVKVRAIQRVVEQAAIDVPGTVAHHPALGRLRGLGSPRAEVSVQGLGARVSVDVACRWPAPVAQIASAVREAVRSEGERIVGMPIHTVDVSIRALGAGEAGAPERRRVQ